MELYPAIDIRGGRVARWGHAHDPPAAGDDPMAIAHGFAAAGARWVHLVDLDRAYGTGDNGALVGHFLATVPLRVQVGGGLRAADAVAELLAQGASRVVLGPPAVMDPELASQLFARHGGERIAVAIEVRDGRVTSRATAEVFDLTPRALADRARASGARTAVYADARRDGSLAGPDLAGAAAIAAAGLEVIVSGGVAGLDDLRAARAAGCAGAIVGRALHAGRFTVAEALACLA